ncbi:hypothetical protein SAMN04488589_0386 [Methanolobus vulcani]|jgi:hypothetical protein|uniref:Uncharacterized protein n=1 Tax=Methanolobus vulcani TaxID=38026 RepID=A0A7Z7AY32_9EURY|nr:hypothetical protein [Methanolobus vulcani]MDK2826386.1 hypothetical protein [Methanolobus sp.]MDK2947386.1 hypothetical protein [Methanolobus sp.]SDF33583.1 hypothetical protein SAMN04488589_0386 [Methanolobus vulcani]
MIDNGIVIEKAIWRIADEYGFDVRTVEDAINFSEVPLDLEKLVGEGIFCFRGPSENVKYDNASICLSNKILANKGVAQILIPLICNRIRNWDHEDIEVLLSDLKKVITIMELNPDDYPGLQKCSIDPKDLPSEKIPDDIKEKCQVWAMDKKGMCLVGIDANKLMHIDDIRKAASGNCS